MPPIKALKIYKLFKFIVIIFLGTVIFSYLEVGHLLNCSSLNFSKIILKTFPVILSVILTKPLLSVMPDSKDNLIPTFLTYINDFSLLFSAF